MNFSRSHPRNCIFVLFLMNWFKYMSFRSVLDTYRLTFDTSVIIYHIHLGSKLKKQTFGVLGVRSTFQVFLCFGVFVLNSIEVKDSRIISGEQFHLMVSVSFPFRIQI